MCCIEARGENYVFLFAANPSGSRLGHIFCTGGKGNASWNRNASRQYTKTSLWAFLMDWRQNRPGMGEVGTAVGRGWFLCGQPRPRHMPYSMLRWHFSGQGWLHFNQPRPIQVHSGTQCTQKRLETCTVSTEDDIGPGPSRKLVRVKQLIVN